MGIVFSIASYIIGILVRKTKNARKFQPLPGITLYDSAPSPCARRVRMTLLEKGIPFNKVEVDLIKGEQLTNEYKHICPNKKVPAISFLDVPGVEDCNLYESNVITEFLDADAFPGPKLYPSSPWRRAQVKMWQDWELGLVDHLFQSNMKKGKTGEDFVPCLHTNTLPFILQLMHGSKDSDLASLPVEISPAKKEYWSRVYDASLSSEEDLKQHAIACFQNLVTLEKALEGREFLVGEAFTSADMSVLPRVSMYSQAGLPIPESRFPNIVAYVKRLGGRSSIGRSQTFVGRLMGALMGSHYARWIVRLGNWRSGRQLRRMDGSVYMDRELSNLPVWKHTEAWQKMTQMLETNSVLLVDCPVYPECWQIKLLLRQKGVKFTTLRLDVEDVVGRWAGSGGLVRIHHDGHDVIGIRAVQDYLDGVFAQELSDLLPREPLLRAKVQTWQAWDQTLGYSELSHLLETRLISKALADRFCADLSSLYDLKTDSFYQSKFLSILLCFVCGVMNRQNSESILEELEDKSKEAVSKARTIKKEEKQWEDLLHDRLNHLDTELQCHDPYLLGQTLTLADVNVFCRLCFLQGLGLVDARRHQNVTRWFEFLVETQPQFHSISQEVAKFFDTMSQ